jgi:hypothetical protein
MVLVSAFHGFFTEKVRFFPGFATIG